MRKKYFTEEERKAAKRENARRYSQSEKGRKAISNYAKTYRETHGAGVRTEYFRERRRSKAGYLDRFIERAKQNTIDTDLTREDIEAVFGDSCPISGREFQYVNELDCFHNTFAPSIDRIDSKLGYYKGNVQIILSCLNRMKNDMPNDEFLELWKALTQ